MNNRVNTMMIFILLVAVLLLVVIDITQDEQIRSLDTRITVIEQRMLIYEDNTKEVFSGYNEMRKTQLNLMKIYEGSGNFNK